MHDVVRCGTLLDGCGSGRCMGGTRTQNGKYAGI